MNQIVCVRRLLLAVLIALGTVARADKVGDLRAFPIEGRVMHVVSNVRGVSGATAEKLAYSNTEGRFALEVPADTWVSDDLTLTVEGGCALRRLLFEVTGKADPHKTVAPPTKRIPPATRTSLIPRCIAPHAPLHKELLVRRQRACVRARRGAVNQSQRSTVIRSPAIAL